MLALTSGLFYHYEQTDLSIVNDARSPDRRHIRFLPASTLRENTYTDYTSVTIRQHSLTATLYSYSVAFTTHAYTLKESL